MTAAHSKWPVAVLGATGAVGQTFIRLLADHPWFTVAEVAAQFAFVTMAPQPDHPCR